MLLYTSRVSETKNDSTAQVSSVAENAVQVLNTAYENKPVFFFVRTIPAEPKSRTALIQKLRVYAVHLLREWVQR